MDGRARLRWLHLALCACAALPAPPALAEQPAAAGPTYPVAVRLVLDPSARAAEYVHFKGGFDGPANPDTRVLVGAQARDAYLVLAGRLFQPVGGGSGDAVLVIEAVRPGLSFDALGWRVSVVHEASLRFPGGEPLGRWTVSGEARLEGLGPGALPKAFARAAKAAAARVEYEFEQPPGVAALLAGRGVTPGKAAPPAPPEVPVVTTLPLLARAFDPPGAPRPAPLYFLDAGPGLSSTAANPVGLAVRGGIATGAVFVQVGPLWLTSLEQSPTHQSSVDALLLTADVGVVLRPLRAVEVRAGAGIGRLSASSGSARASRTVPTWVLTAHYASPPSVGSSGLRIGLEARKVVGGTLDFTAERSTQVAVQVAGLSFTVLLGYEFAR